MTTDPLGPHAVDIPEVAALAVPADAFLLDVRERDEWAAGHAPDAVLVPMTELAGRVAELPLDTRIHVICRSGNRSGYVTRWLRAHGVDAVNVAGGMIAWAQGGRPVVPGAP